MAYQIRLQVWGDYACFTRPGMKVERVSYDVITPWAARGILKAIHWEPAFAWAVDRIQVLKPIRFQIVRRNEVGSKVPTAVRATIGSSTVNDMALVVGDERTATVLCDVAYIIDAHLTMSALATPKDSPAKHYDMFTRRARRRECFHRPCLGMRGFPAHFALQEGDRPHSNLPESQGNRDLGWMLLDIDYKSGMVPRFFRAVMQGGVILVPPFEAASVTA